MLYKNCNEPINDRIKDLIGRMTLEEKVNQLALCEPKGLIDNGKFSADKADKLLRHKNIGAITTPNLSVVDTIHFINDFQTYIKDKTELGIPVLMVAECLHGLMAAEATVFPQSIALGSSFNTKLIEEMATAIAKETSLIGAKQGLAPDLDLAREPRWGRVEETYGEDPYLCERLGVAYIRGLQGEQVNGQIGKEKIAATLKHYVAHGSPEGGVNLSPVMVGERQLRELYMPPFRAAIEEAGALSVMNAYSEIDGIPCASSKYLLTEVLRGEWGFEGYIIADFESVAMLKYFQKTAHTYKEAGRQAFKAGLDMEAPVELCYGDNLIELVNEGIISMYEINTSVERVLRVKFATGLFDDDKLKTDTISEVYNCQSHRDLAREIAEETIVLLENKGNLLPLSKDIEKIAVIGPNAASAQIGDYTMDKESLVSPLEGLTNQYGEEKIVYAQGCDIIGASKENFDEAIMAAQEAEVAIVCVGGTSMVSCGIGWETDSEFEGFAFKNKYATSGEGFDRSNLTLPGVQQELVEAIVKTGTPTVVVLINGRPYATPWISENATGLIEMWYAGEEGGNALASIIAGHVNPSGKLPISIPKHVGQTPIYYNHKPSARGFYGKPGTPTEPGRDYVFLDTKPLYPFGYGLSYTTFEYSNIKTRQKRVSLSNLIAQNITVEIEVTNAGAITGKEVVQLYINDVISSVSTPVKALRGFEKIELDPNKTKKVAFELSFDDFALYDKNMKKVVEPGMFEIMIGEMKVELEVLGD